MREMGEALVDPVADVAVQEIYQRARCDSSRPVGSVRLAVALFGERCIRLAARSHLPGRSALVWPDGVPVVHLRRDLTPRQINHAVAHELGEWILHIWSFHGPQAEDLAGRIGAALCVPRPAFHAAHRELGENVPALCEAFTVSESLMALRIAASDGAHHAAPRLHARGALGLAHERAGLASARQATKLVRLHPTSNPRCAGSRRAAPPSIQPLTLHQTLSAAACFLTLPTDAMA